MCNGGSFCRVGNELCRIDHRCRSRKVTWCVVECVCVEGGRNCDISYPGKEL